MAAAATSKHQGLGHFEADVVAVKIPRCSNTVCLAANPTGLSYCPKCATPAPPREYRHVADIKFDGDIPFWGAIFLRVGKWFRELHARLEGTS